MKRTIRSRNRSFSILLAPMLVGAAVADPVPAPSAALAPAVPPNGEMGFVVTHFGLTWFDGENDCPDGPAGMLRDNLLATLPEGERVRLSRPENDREFQRLISGYIDGPGGTNICSNMERFPRAPQKMVQGRIAVGLDLDGDSSGNAPGTCAHANFTSPTGEPGIDNQVWRSMGCLTRFRGIRGELPDMVELNDGALSNGEHAQVIVLRGIDNMVRDDNVEIIYANTADRAIRDSQGKFLTGASYAISDDRPNTPKRNVMKGRIVNGVLEAQTPRFQLKLAFPGSGNYPRSSRARWDFSRVRLRIMFQPDGSLKGLVGGYQPFEQLVMPQHIAGRLAADVGWDCAVIYATLKQNADGDPDPRTGQCTTISSNYDFTAVRAFVIDPRRDAALPAGRPRG